MGIVKKIDFSAKRLSSLAEKYYSEGKYVPALHFTYRELEEYGESDKLYFRLCDIYENMGLNSSAVNWWFKILDGCSEDDLPDVYEGLAVNYLNMGKDAQSAYYYNCLIETDDQIPEEMKYEIAEAFSEKKKSPLKISYPPELADYSEEMDKAARALKKGDCKGALLYLNKVQKGSKEYSSATEMKALALLLSGEIVSARELCEETLETEPDNVRILSTLGAAYLEEGKTEKSRAIALRLSTLKTQDEDELYKIATVCCENGLHAEAYERFVELGKISPHDGKILYFKGVSAYNSGNIDGAIEAFDTLCTVYPDAAVVEFYLKELREYRESLQKGEPTEKPELTYFYQLPQEERESRTQMLIEVMKSPRAEAEILGVFAETGGLFRWAFDELDGMDHDLQYLAIMAAAHARADAFLREISLDNEVLDLLKLELLRAIFERNESAEWGIVVGHVYRRIRVLPIKIGRKSRKKFISAYARTASKFVVVNDRNAEKLKATAEELYRALEKYDCFEQAQNVDDCSCAIYLLAELKELGGNVERAALAFDANADRVRVLLSTAISARNADDAE